MLVVVTGNDNKGVQSATSGFVRKNDTGTSVLRVTDTASLADLQFACSGGGMFAEKRLVVLSNIFSSDRGDLQEYMRSVLPVIAKMQDLFIIVESDVNAEDRKLLEKYADKVEKFEVKKAKEYPTVFGLVDALKRKDKKGLWVGYQKELMKGSAAEMILGTLFWGAKKMFTEARSPEEKKRAEQLIVFFTELPHEARRRGEDLEYALENALLSVA